MWVHHYTVCVTGQRSESEVSTNLIFPFSVLAAINLVGWWFEMKGLESDPDVSWGFFYGQRPTQPHQGYGLSLGAEGAALRVRLYLISCSL